ncbi:TetR family transcriptional regulator [Rhizobium chutanense]|uniref:TetR/AcrR family transcriptional regulator n=1 Tax=Rhizobium chutanense TaxID=2035448 RepID=A0A3S0QGZ2_9HYPH|nr:TetR family transcriptional regulator [Rhizobium chutanense]RUM03856.1 TetR/AcrR family transcriptional regulator [Rhizobium chutanense]
MNKVTSPRISTRKSPKQARSNDLVGAILLAAVRVLAEEGAQRFTTARVAERAGVSVGSLYQYFPNKASILFRLQSEEWQQTAGMLAEILSDRSKPPFERLRLLVHAFLHSECEEASVRIALSDAAPLYRDAPEAEAAKRSTEPVMEAFMREVLPAGPSPVRDVACELIMTTLRTVGQDFSATPRTEEEIAAFSAAMAQMFCAYLESLVNRADAR